MPVNPHERNIFTAIAQALWAQGNDGEEIAKDLAEALRKIIEEGKGPTCDLEREFIRLLKRGL